MNTQASRAVLISLCVVVGVWSVNGIYLSMLSKYSAASFWTADLVQWVVLPSVLAWLLANRYQVRPQHYGLDPSALGFRVLLWSVPAALTFYAAYFWVTEFAGSALGNPGGFFAFQDVFPDGALGTLVWLYSALSAGIVESVFFIGLPWLLWSQTRADDRVWFTALWSAIFAAAHWEQGPHVFIGALAFNLVACAWYFRLRTLWPVVIGHVIVDLIDFG
jgi:hypothetical protein